MSKKEHYNIKEVVEMLNYVQTKVSSKKAASISFNFDEVKLLINSLFYKDRQSLVKLILKNILDKKSEYLNLKTSDARKLNFFNIYIHQGKSAAAAARMSGYSEKTAKQQGYRIYKEIKALLNDQPSHASDA